MSLRLRILLLIAAINVVVLLLVVQAGFGGGRSGEPMPPQAVTEALDFAGEALLRGLPAELSGGYIEYAVLVQRNTARAEALGSAAASAAMESAKTSLRQRVAEGRIGYEVDTEGVTVVDANGAGVRVGFSERARWEARAGARRTYLVLAAGTLLLIGATYLILRTLVLRPLERLEEASEAVAEGRPPPTVPVPRGGGEMARLIENFNRMAAEVHEYQAHLEDRVMDTLERVTATERRLVVAQRLAATGTLAAGFAHEINNPVGGILNAVRKLRAGDLPPERREEYFELVQDGVDRIRTIVERILHFTPHEREPAPIEVGEACRRALALATHRADKARVELVAEVAGPLDGVVGDAQELTQAILNLLLNAIDAIPEDRSGKVTLSARIEEDEVRIDVTDDGVGMDEETAQRCVDLFYSTKPEGEGTGLGLGIVQHIVIDHGGSLEIQSEPGRGTRVRIRLPRGMDK
ncbi:MAG: sensor histidine kinase [Planctomycetota bacterium]